MFIELRSTNNGARIYVRASAIEAIAPQNGYHPAEGSVVMVQSHNNGGFKVVEHPDEIIQRILEVS